MKEKKAAQSAAAAQPAIGRTRADGLPDIDLACVDGAAESGQHQDLSSFALPGFADSASVAPATTSEASPAVRPRAGSAGLKSLLRFRHSKKSVSTAVSPPLSPAAAAAAAASDENGRPIVGAGVGAHAAARAGTSPSPADDQSPGSRGGFKGLLDSFRPRSKSDAASLRAAMLQRRRHQSGQAALGATSSSASTSSQGAAQQAAAPPSSVGTAPAAAAAVTAAAAAAENGQTARPRATSFGARDAVLAKKAAAASAAINGGSSGGSSGTAMSQLLSGGGSSALSPRKLTPVEKNHHHPVSAYGGESFSGKALLYRTLPAGDSGLELASSGHRRAMSVSSANRRTAFKEQSWFSTDGEVDMEIEDLVEDDPMVFVKFMKAHKCYNLIPTSAKLVIFDVLLSVKKAFFALVYNNVRAALLWDSSKQDYVGMLTISDFILILQKYYKSPNGKMDELEEHQISSWRLALKDHYKPKLVSISPDDSVNDAVRMLLDNKVHRLPVIDPITGNALYVMTHKRILKFIYLFMKNLPTPLFMQETLAELKIGTYSGIAKVSPETTLIEALNTFVAKRVSALPVVAKDGRVVDIYAKFDVINLAADKTYQNLDVPVSEALSYRKIGGLDTVVHRCHLNDKLAVIVEKIVKAGVHRLIVCGDHDELLGIVSLSDILSRITLDPSLSGAKPSTVADVARAAPTAVTGGRAASVSGAVQ